MFNFSHARKDVHMHSHFTSILWVISVFVCVFWWTTDVLPCEARHEVVLGEEVGVVIVGIASWSVEEEEGVEEGGVLSTVEGGRVPKTIEAVCLCRTCWQVGLSRPCLSSTSTFPLPIPIQCLHSTCCILSREDCPPGDRWRQTDGTESTLAWADGGGLA